MNNCPICGLAIQTVDDCECHANADGMVFVATYGEPQPEGFPIALEEDLMWSIAGALQFIDMKRRVGTYENADRIWHVILEEIADVFASDNRIGFDKKQFKDRCSVFPYRELEGIDG